MSNKSFAGPNGVGLYKAVLSQIGASAPLVSALSPANTIFDVVWTRSSMGRYHGTKPGAFPSGRTFMQASFGPEGNADLVHVFEYDPPNVVLINCRDDTGAIQEADGWINIQIEVWA